MSFNLTIIIIIITAVVSYRALQSPALMNKLIFEPAAVAYRKEWYRFFSNGLIHADIGHLLFNMYTLYLFGKIVENNFMEIFGSYGKLLFLIMYVSALGACLLPQYLNKSNFHVRSLGASGAVSAVIFAAILIEPLNGIGFLFLPGLNIPGFIFGPLFIIVSAYLDKRGGTNINHSAHLWGALYGVCFLIVMSFALHTGFNPIGNFVDSIKSRLMN
jgi:membrane associated rhomboid family serine protease